MALNFLERLGQFRDGVFFNQSPEWKRTTYEWQPLMGLSKDKDPLYQLMNPQGRLCSRESINTYTDHKKRFLPLPEELVGSGNEITWEMESFFSRLFPDDNATQMLFPVFLSLMKVSAKNFYERFAQTPLNPNSLYTGLRESIIEKGNLEDNGLENPDIYGYLFQPYFAEISESSANGCAMDKIYRAIGTSLKAMSSSPSDNPWQEYCDRKASGNRRDLDICLVSSDDDFSPDFITANWKIARGDNNEILKRTISNGRKSFTGRDLVMVEVANQSGKYEGWRLIRETVDDGIEIIVLQTGIFSLSDSPLKSKENSFEIEKNTFSVEISAIPQTRNKIKEMKNHRMGDLASYSDDEIRLQVKSTSFREMKLVVSSGEYEWHFNKYHRNKYYLLHNLDIYNDPSRLIDLFTHSLKIMSTRVGLYEIPKYFSDKGETEFNAKLWNFLPDFRTWSEYYIYNILGAAHLSPLVFGSHLIPNSRLDNLPVSLREKVASHGAENTLSIGNLWPEIFPKMTNEQIAVFLENLPDQKEYIDTYLTDIDREEFPIEHQGLYFVMTALRKALSLENPDIPNASELIPWFDGNYLLQALYVFKHPKDEEIIEIAKEYQDSQNQLLENLFQNPQVTVPAPDKIF